MIYIALYGKLSMRRLIRKNAFTPKSTACNDGRCTEDGATCRNLYYSTMNNFKWLCAQPNDPPNDNTVIPTNKHPEHNPSQQYTNQTPEKGGE